MSVEVINSLSTIASDAARANSSTSATAKAASTLNMDFTTYLKILTTQLQNQDPTNATDPNQFTQELIAMAQVQSQITNNEYMANLTRATSANGLANGVGYINKYVRSTTEDGDFSLQGGAAEIGYTLDSATSGATITISDSSGKEVAKLSGGTASGDNYVTWNGAKSDGTTAADGAYTFSVSATDSGGNSVKVSNPTALFLVTGVQGNSDGTLTLEAGKLSLLSSDVTGVYTASTLPTATTGTVQTTS